MIFFTYDLDTYREQVRGFYFDFEQRAPGPLVTTSDEVVEALGGVDHLPRAGDPRYDAFAAEFCEFDDGHAAARVVDRVFGA